MWILVLIYSATVYKGGITSIQFADQASCYEAKATIEKASEDYFGANDVQGICVPFKKGGM